MSLNERDKRMEEYLNWAFDNLRESNDDDELWDFLDIFFNVQIPRTVVVPGNRSPFDFVADTFFERVTDTLCIGNRNGGKTYNYAVKNALDALFKGCEIASIGAIVAQAEKQYNYTRDILNMPFINKFLVTSIMKNTVVETPKGKSIIQILPGTMNGVNSPHPQKANVDEIELMEWKILQEAMSMPASNANASAALCLTSSRKFSYGNMEILLSQAEERMLELYKWSIWETIEECKDDRSGVYPVKYTFVPYGEKEPITIDVLTKNVNLVNREVMSDVARKDPVNHTGCLSCQLIEVCQTKAKRARGFYRIEDTIKKFRMLDRETWDSQWESLKPMSSGLIYKQYSDATHCLYGDNQWIYNPQMVTTAALDAGFEHAAVLSFFQDDPVGNVYMFDEVVMQHITSHELVEFYWYPKLAEYGFVNSPSKYVIYDPSAKDEAEQLKQKGIKMVQANNEVDSGIKTVRSFLKTSTGKVRFYINEKCKNARSEFTKYHYREGTEVPVKEDDHSMDTIRYNLHTRFPIVVGKKKFSAKVVG